MRDSEDPRNFLQELSLRNLDKKQQRLCVIRWVAESPNYAIKITRKTAAIEFFSVSERTFERWLHDASKDGFTPTAFKKAKTVLYTWESFITGVWAAERSKGIKVTPSLIHQLVKEEAERQGLDSYPSYKIVIQFLNSLGC